MPEPPRADATLPADTVTLLFTDIEGSTVLWEQDGARMSQALAAHDALARSVVEGHQGTVVKMIGDGMHAVFDDALDALAATVALQQALADPIATNGVALHVRCGLHAGVVERRDNDFFGSPVNRAARIMNAAHGGQVLLSQIVAYGVRDRLPAAVSLRDLGKVRLKDLSTPEHVYQVVHPQLRQDFPALRSLEATPNNLPEQITSFIGRERELAAAKDLLGGARLLTLLGMGGLGKTRLSLQIAADVLEKYPDGVWFVDLAPLRDPSLVPSAAAQVLGVQEEPSKPPTQTLCAHVKDRKLLLILDNCEHLVKASASLVDALLRSAPEVRVLATSREALHIRGEQIYPVLPLAVPDRKAGVGPLLRSEAAQLFVERARLQKPDFVVTDREAPAIADLCARLEGIPLALELAAARLCSLTVQEINSRLKDRFKLLTGGDRLALERQQTLRALVAWSYDLLQPNEQILLDRLSVFTGGFDLPAAEVVCGGEPLARDDILDQVTSLVEKSLVMVDQWNGGSRYGLLETIREFAQQRLVKCDDLAATATRHCEYYLDLAKAARADFQGPKQAEWTRRLEVELDNLRAAIALAFAGGVDPVIAVKFEVALARFRTLRGYSTEGRNNIRKALALPDMQDPNVARAHALYIGGALAKEQGDHGEALKMLTECLSIRRALGYRLEAAATLSILSALHLHQGDLAKAHDCDGEAISIYREVGDRIGEAIGLLNLGENSVQQGDQGSARKLFEQCLVIACSIRHQELESECERNLGELELDAGNLQAAQTRFARSLKVCRDAGDKRNEAIALWCVGKVDMASGDPISARNRLVEALCAMRALELRAEALDCLEDCAALLHAIGASFSAVQLQSAVEAGHQVLALSRRPRREAKWKRNLEATRVMLGDAAFDTAWTQGQVWVLDEAIGCALTSMTTSAAAS